MSEEPSRCQEQNISAENTEEPCTTNLQVPNIQGRSLFSLLSRSSNGSPNIEQLFAEALERSRLNRNLLPYNANNSENRMDTTRQSDNSRVCSADANTAKEIANESSSGTSELTIMISGEGSMSAAGSDSYGERGRVRFSADISTRDLPPAYTSVIHSEDDLFLRIGQFREDAHLNLMLTRFGEARPSPQFIYRIPPPSYAESELGTLYFDMAVPPVPESATFWGPRPLATVCPICGSFNITKTKSKIDRSTHLLACFLCVCLCWPCCLLPYCTTSCQSTEHYCRSCSALLGIYRPF